MKSKISSKDWSMYAQTAQLAKTNANHAFGTRIGDTIDYGVESVQRLPIFADTASVVYTGGNAPFGVHSLETSFTIGSNTGNFRDPINVAARSLYAKYWAKNSSISNFQEMDLIIYTMMSAQCIGLISWLKTIYHTCFFNSALSAYAREGILMALGIDPKDMHKHINDLEGYIQMKLLDFNSFQYDKSIPLYRMVYDAYSYVLKDSPNTAKTQYYVKRPGYVMKYNRTGEQIGSISYVYTQPLGDNQYFTYDQLIRFVDDIFDSFLGSNYIASISSALEKALGGATLVLTAPEHGKAIVPVFDEVALRQLQNAYVPSSRVYPRSITQNVVDRTVSQYVGSSVISDFPGKFEIAFDGVNKIVHTPGDKDATPEDVLVLTALTPGVVVSANGNDGLQASYLYHGMEVATGAYVFGIKADGAIGRTRANSTIFLNRGESMVQAAQSLMTYAKAYREFDFMPSGYVWMSAAGGASVDFAYIADYDYSSPFTVEDLRKVHSTACLAAFGIPDSV